MKSNSNAGKEEIINKKTINEPSLNDETNKIKKFYITFTFKYKSMNLNPIIVELDFNESTRKILPNNKYFDKMTHHLKEWKHVVLYMWNKYLNDKIEGYNYNEKAMDGAGDYCILFLFLEMVSPGWLVSSTYWYKDNNFNRHWYEEEEIKAYADRFGHYARKNGNDNNFSYLDNLFKYQMKSLNEIIIPNDLPSEIIGQLHKLENFCQCRIVTPNTKNINFANKDQAVNINLSNETLINDTSNTLNQIDVKLENHKIIKTPKRIKRIKKKPVIKKQVSKTDPKANLNSGTIPTNKTNINQNENASIQELINDTSDILKPIDVNFEKRAINQPPQVINEQITNEKSELNIKSDTISINQTDTKQNKNDPTQELINDTSDILKPIDVNLEKRAINQQPQVINKQMMNEKPEVNIKSDTISINQTDTKQNKNDQAMVKYNEPEKIREPEVLERIRDSEILVQKLFDSVRNTLEKQQTTNVKQSDIAHEEKIKQPITIVEQKNASLIHKCNLAFLYIALILCLAIFIGVPLGAFLSKILFTLKIGIPVIGAMILSAIGFRFSLAELDKLKQQNSNILLSSSNKNIDYPKTFVLSKKTVQENKFPFLNKMNLEDKKDVLDDKNNQENNI